MDMSIPDQKEKARLKGAGYLPNKDPERCSARIVTPGGVLTSEQSRVLSELADRFGCGKVTITSRLGIEIPGVAYADIEAFEKALAVSGLTVGGTGPKVRPIIACKGTVCTHGIYDTQSMAAAMHERFYVGWHDTKLPHKIKIGLGGCPNNCVKPNINDIGVVGQRVPALDAGSCTGCGACAAKCPMKCIRIDSGKAVIDRARCTNCGECTHVCAAGAMTAAETGFAVYIGGMWGKTGRVGERLDRLFTYDGVFEVIERTLKLYTELGQPGERLGAVVTRTGRDAFFKKLLEGM